MTNDWELQQVKVDAFIDGWESAIEALQWGALHDINFPIQAIDAADWLRDRKGIIPDIQK